jgi:hypothetical protein
MTEAAASSPEPRFRQRDDKPRSPSEGEKGDDSILGFLDLWFSSEEEQRGGSLEAWWLVVARQQFIRGTTVVALVLWEHDWVHRRHGKSATGDSGSGCGLRRGELQWLSVEARRWQWRLRFWRGQRISGGRSGQVVYG